jgi:beta-mannanase
MKRTYLLLIVLALLTVGTTSFAMSRAVGEIDPVNHPVFVGVFREGAPRNMNYITKYEEMTGKKQAMIMWYQDWAQAFPLESAQNVIAAGAIPQIVWEPWYWGDNNKIKLNDITSGQWDSYITTWAKDIKKFGKPIFLRVAHEFNIEGYPWGIVNNDKDPQNYVKAYRHVVDIFKKEKVTNVKWVWCFMNYSFPDESWNDWVKAYPGDAYVDWVGIDGYNWGTTQSWSDWQAFKYLFRDQVRQSKKLWPTKPIMVAEFAAAEKGGDKAAWIKEIPGYLKSSLRDIDAILWFDEKKEADWRVNSSSKAQAAYAEIMKDPLFSSEGVQMAALSVAAKKPGRKVAQAIKAAGAVKIDGDLKEWTKAVPITMADLSFVKEGLGWQGPNDLSGFAYLMWDKDNLYLAANITDKITLVNKQTGGNIWNGDGIEIVLSSDPQADPERIGFTGKDYQIGFGTGDGKGTAAAIWNWQKRRAPGGSEIAVKRKGQPQGYFLEAKIPWEFFRGKFIPSEGVKLGFDIAFDDADQTGARERQMIWNGDYYFYKDPSVWGRLELK